MKLSEIMTTKVVTVGPDDEFDVALGLFERYPFRHLPVVHMGALVSLLSRRDLSLATGWRDVKTRRLRGPKDPHLIRHIMRDRVVSLTPDHEVDAAASMMVGKRVGAIPILEANLLVGLVTGSDILAAMRKRNPRALWGQTPEAGAKVSEYMQHEPDALESGSDLSEAAGICRRKALSHLPVTEGGVLVGLLSEHELRFELEEHEGPADQILSEVMVRDLITIGPDEDLSIAADSMINNKVSGLPVVQGEGLVGFLTDQDIMQHFTAKFRVPGF